MPFFLLYAEGYNKYLALKQWSTIIYWNILKSSEYNCCHSAVPYNQLSEQSILQLSLYHTMASWVDGWVNLEGREECLHSPK